MTAWQVHARGTLHAAPDLAVARTAVEQAQVGSERAATRQLILDFVDAHPDALHRSCAEGHLTGSALVVDPTTRRILLLFHSKVQRWLQPGGHADGDGDLAHVAGREAEEETGIAGLSIVTPAVDLDVHEFRSARSDEPVHLHLDVRYLVLAPPGATTSGNHESEQIVWVSEPDLGAYDVDPGTIRMARAGLRALDELEGRASPITG